MDWTSLLLEILGGLSIFLYAMAELSNALKDAVGERLKSWLAHMTANPIIGLLSGCAVTVVLDSSSVTIILIIALIHAGALSLEQSLAMILGSNIGTTVSSQIYAIEIDKFSPILLAVGLAVVLIHRKQKTGQVIFLGGLLLFGLHLLGEATKPLRDSGSVEIWLRGLEDPVRGALVGAAATGALQSSSAMMGIAIKLADAGVLSLQAGVAVMLGSEVGTCLDTFVASVGRSREALRAGVFHTLFNIVSVALGLIFYREIAAAAQWVGGDSISRQLANAHVMFNVLGAISVLPLIPLCLSALKLLVPPEMPLLSPERSSAS